MTTTTIHFNGVALVTAASTLEALLRQQHLTDKRGIAVALNEQVIPKKDWPHTPLPPNAEVLVITATQGG
ncbi:sulfur carrier protein ThiS [Eisenibacter elegans]|jgi:sulfur carrier protein|uniref:sulfur carrier protein ThiS n=1 Tax=Eisenibacter elegans TaxID=997 RepID=UPI0004243966|nr:sulfur carrier protein ThiS [Eisenibacter elegans]